MITVAIIEDDLSVSLDYEMVLSELGINKIKQYTSIEQAELKFKKEIPDLVFLDLKLDGVNGLEIFKKIDLEDSAVIVITGHQDEVLLDLLKTNKVASLMIKPINQLALKYEIIKVLEMKKSKSSSSFTYLDFKSKLQKLSFSDILYLETTGNYTTINTECGKHVVKKSLANVTNSLPAHQFQRIFRNLLVNIDKIQTVNYSTNLITLTNKVSLPIGLKYKQEIKQLLHKNFKIIK